MPAQSGVEVKLYPCSGNQMPCSQMISMNMSPPRPTAARKLDSVPNVNARMRNKPSRNIGFSTRLSTSANAVRNAAPSASAESTNGLVHPIGSDLYGSMP